DLGRSARRRARARAARLRGALARALAAARYRGAAAIPARSLERFVRALSRRRRAARAVRARLDARRDRARTVRVRRLVGDRAQLRERGEARAAARRALGRAGSAGGRRARQPRMGAMEAAQRGEPLSRPTPTACNAGVAVALQDRLGVRMRAVRVGQAARGRGILVLGTAAAGALRRGYRPAARADEALRRLRDHAVGRLSPRVAVDDSAPRRRRGERARVALSGGSRRMSVSRIESWHRVRRLLVIRADNIGDVVLTGPALRAVKRALPTARLELLASPAGAA